MSARYEIRIDPAYTFEVDIFGKIDVPETVYIDGPMGGYSSPNQNVIGAIRQQSADLDKLRAELAAAVAERDRFAIQRDQARLTIREIAQILIDQIGSVGPENAINAALRACEVIESMATRLAALAELEKAAAQPVAYQYAHPYFGGGKIWREEQRWNGHTSDEARALYAALPTPDARADARIAELERECSQWRDELRIYRETESARIAELEQSVTVRDTEIARLETDLELARRDGEHLRLFARIRFGYAPGDYCGICIPCSEPFIGDKRATTCPKCADAAIDAARANGGES